jgi:hypothetical protein
MAVTLRQLVAEAQITGTDDGCDVEAACCLNVINPYLG